MAGGAKPAASGIGKETLGSGAVATSNGRSMGRTTGGSKPAASGIDEETLMSGTVESTLGTTV